jgi:hypothetical protein
MGAHTSALLADIFIHYLEQNYIINTLKKHHVTDYYRYKTLMLCLYSNHIFSCIQLHYITLYAREYLVAIGA